MHAAVRAVVPANVHVVVHAVVHAAVHAAVHAIVHTFVHYVVFLLLNTDPVIFLVDTFNFLACLRFYFTVCCLLHVSVKIGNPWRSSPVACSRPWFLAVRSATLPLGQYLRSASSALNVLCAWLAALAIGFSRARPVRSKAPTPQQSALRPVP